MDRSPLHSQTFHAMTQPAPDPSLTGTSDPSDLCCCDVAMTGASSKMMVLKESIDDRWLFERVEVRRRWVESIVRRRDYRACVISLCIVVLRRYQI